jgi:predicted PurR-regulated permease PerM
MQRGVPRWLWGGAIGLGCAALLYALRGVLAPILIAFGLAYVLDPPLDRLEARNVPRAAGICLLLVPALLLILVLFLWVLPAVARDIAALIDALPHAITTLLMNLEPWLRERGVTLPHSSNDALAALSANIEQLAPDAMSIVQSAAGLLFGGTVSAIGVIGVVVTVPVLAFYFLRDFDLIVAAAIAMLPGRARGPIVAFGREIDAVLGDFVRGQLMVMAILAGLYALAFSLAGVTLAIPIGLVAGLVSFVPYVGGAIALTLALLMSVLHFDGFAQLMWVVAAYASVSVLENFVIVPRVVGDKLGLPALWVILALMIGGDLFGFAGVMLALPAAAIGKVITAHAMRHYYASALYAGGDVPVPQPAAPVMAASPGVRRLARSRRRARRKLRMPGARVRLVP